MNVSRRFDLWLFTAFALISVAAVVSLRYTPQPTIQAAAANPSAVLTQLGIKGVTAQGGAAAYANYLPKLDAGGKLDFDMIPYLNPAALLRTTGVFHVDATGGTDTAGNGAVTSPYKTLQFAFTDVGTAIRNPTFMLAPGDYTNSTAYVTSTNWTHITFVGWNRRNTTVTGPLLLKMASDPVVDIYGVAMQQIQQGQVGRGTTVNLYDEASLASFLNTVPLTPGKTAAINYDPTVDTYPTGPTLTVRALHEASALRYRPAIADRTIWTNSEQTVAGALDEISNLRLLPKGTAAGDLARWNGTNWVPVYAGASNEVLFGGSAPGFRTPESTFLTNYYTIAQVGTVSNGVWTSVTNWVRAGYSTTPEVTQMLTAQRILLTNWVDTVFYRTNEVSALIAAYDAGLQGSLAGLTAQIAACYAKTGGVVTGSAQINGALNVTGALTKGGNRAAVWVTEPALPVSLGNAGEIAYGVSNSVPRLYWYDANEGKWARIEGTFAW